MTIGKLWKVFFSNSDKNINTTICYYYNNNNIDCNESNIDIILIRFDNDDDLRLP